MNRRHDVVLVVVICILLSVPLVYVGAYGNLLGGKISNSSDLEGRKYTEVPKVSIESISGGQYQDDTESYLSDHIPFRDSVMLGNAALQRSVIELANLPFGFDAYPTFFGSPVAYVPKYQALYEIPKQGNKQRSKALQQCANMINSEASKHDGTAWYVALADRSKTSLASPIHDFVVKAADADYYRREFLDKLAGNICVVDLFYESEAEFVEDYFATDHHWRIQGAVKAYQDVCAAMGIEAASYDYHKAYAPLIGATARTGLYDACTDTMDDVNLLQRNLRVVVNGETKDASFINASYAKDYVGYRPESKFASVYGGYFHSNYRMIEIQNDEASNDEALLIVGDSFTNCIERLFAQHFKTVYVVDPRYFNREFTRRWKLGEFIEEKSVSSVIFMLSSDNVKPKVLHACGVK